MDLALFIVFEGPDGSGKTTAAKGVFDHYVQEGIEIVHTREPGGTRIGEEIRQILLNPDHGVMDYRTEALLYAASRAQHIEEKIKPALQAGKLVICERFVFSSLVYQGLVRGLGVDEVQSINDFATNGLRPDLTLYLDPGQDSSLDRIVDRPLDRIEQEGTDFSLSVQASYAKLAQLKQDEIKRIDASQSKDKVIDDCIDMIERKRSK